MFVQKRPAGLGAGSGEGSRPGKETGRTPSISADRVRRVRGRSQEAGGRGRAGAGRPDDLFSSDPEGNSSCPARGLPRRHYLLKVRLRRPGHRGSGPSEAVHFPGARINALDRGRVPVAEGVYDSPIKSALDGKDLGKMSTSRVCPRPSPRPPTADSSRSFRTSVLSSSSHSLGE